MRLWNTAFVIVPPIHSISLSSRTSQSFSLGGVYSLVGGRSKSVLLSPLSDSWETLFPLFFILLLSLQLSFFMVSIADRMASKLKQLQSKAGQASQFLSKHGTAYYKQLMEQNKQYVQEPATVEKCNEFSKQLFYTRVASLPSRNESFRKELDYVKNL
ncbi:hypothetical protein L1987_14147 [Smallanthus sonchifolius]|uniref:Uncharacterized protein n=1 Tax=Smallanthus sonchifolius TaxID=185202 RepID=A0ACB9J2E5_9ASTR|nr:hypothetical protein L1987_14147 [Smallanthus sonchifolius]